MIELEQEPKKNVTPSIKVIGVGGAGGNTVNSIIDSGYKDVECIVANTDAQALELSKAPHKIQLGQKSTKGLGTGANPELGRRAAEEDLDKVLQAAGYADIAFLTGGMGGGTGSGALPVIAHALREKGVLTIAIVTKPFQFEGKRRANIADQALTILKKQVDTLLIIPNQKLIEVVDEHVSMIDAFAMINDILVQSVKGVSDIISKPGHINVDFADVKTIMHAQGLAVMGTARATGPQRAQEAARRAITSPLLENMSIQGAYGVLLNITGGRNLALHEISHAASIVYEQASKDAQIIIGSVIDESLTDEVSVTIIATGFEKEPAPDISTRSEVKIKPTVRDVQQYESELSMQNVTEAVYHMNEPETYIPKTTAQTVRSISSEQTVEILERVQHQKAENSPLLVDGESLFDIPTFLRKKNQSATHEPNENLL